MMHLPRGKGFSTAICGRTVSICFKRPGHKGPDVALAIFPFQQRIFVTNKTTISPGKAALSQETWEIVNDCQILLPRDPTWSAELGDSVSSPSDINGLGYFILHRLPLELDEWKATIRVEDLFVGKLGLVEPLDATPISELFAYSFSQLQEGLEYFLRSDPTLMTRVIALPFPAALNSGARMGVLAW